MDFINTNKILLKEKFNIILDDDVDGETHGIIQGKDEIFLAVKRDEKWITLLNKNENSEVYIKGLVTENVKSYFLILGFGNGFFIRNLLKYIGDNKILIFERDIENLKYACRISDLTDIIMDKRVNLKLWNNKTEVEDILSCYVTEVFFANKMVAMALPNYDIAYKAEVEEATMVIKKFYDISKVNYETFKYFKEKIIECVFDNMPYMVKNKNLIDFKDKFKGKTSVVVSAGPSLSKNIKILKENKDKVLIITGTRNVKGLLDEGIVPHVVCILDSGDIVYDLMKDADMEKLTDVLFVSCESGSSKAVEAVDSNLAFCSIMFREFLSNITGNEYDGLSHGGSVAHFCTSVAQYMGSDRIVLIGQDLAFTDNKLHDDSANLYDDNSILNQGDYFYVESNDGGKVLTNSVMYHYKMWFEDVISNENLNIINATEGGAKIKGARVYKLSEALAESLEDIKAFEIIREELSLKSEIKYNKLSNKLKNLKQEVTLIENKYKSGYKLTEDMESYFKGNFKINIKEALIKWESIKEFINKKVNAKMLLNVLSTPYLKQVMANSKYMQRDDESEFDSNIKFALKNREVCLIYIKCCKKICIIIDEVLEKINKKW